VAEVKVNRRKKTARGTLPCAAALLALILGSAAMPPGLAAQQPRRNPPPGNTTPEYTTVARANLSRVGASAAEIEAVLRKDPGLMVEVKRWVAERATELGQILSDGDLTDQAIYDRLQNDAELRAAATALLQRYGYLTPTPNPNSEVAKEREIMLKERAIQLARVEEQQRTKPPGSEQIPQEQRASCDPRIEANCPPTQMTTQPGAQQPLGPRYGAPESVPSPSPFEPPLAPPMLPRPTPWPPAGAPPVETANSFGATTIPASSTTSPNGPGSVFGSPLGIGPMPPPSSGPGLGSGWEASGANTGELGPRGENGFYSGQQSGGNVPPEFSSLSPRSNGWQPRGTRGSGRIETPRLVPRPNPFADIPSLYDMYLQAAPRPAKPERFGMEVFENTGAMTQMLPMDLPVGPNYMVGPGDGLTISLWGSVSERLFRVVDRTGRVSLPEVGPLEVSGRTLGEVQQAVEQLLRTQFRSISADVSLTRLRTVRVYVVGDVAHPGAYDVSSLSTPLNALFAAGGPTATGSLRVVKHYRGNQLVQTVDLYDLLLHGVRAGINRLEDGDTVLVPPLGPEVTVEGMVRRPAIYELDGEKDLAQVLELAGGILPAATLKHIEVDRLVAHEKRTMLSVNLPDGDSLDAAEKQLASFAIQDGDDVRVFPVAPYTQDAVYLEGHVLRPGKYAYHAGMKLTDLISSYKDLLPQPATSYAEIIRLEPPDYRPRVDDFNLARALADPAAAPKLEPLDTVRIFGRYDFEDAPTVWVGGDVRRPGLYRTDGQIRLRDAIELAGGLGSDADLNWAQVYEPEANGALRVASVNLREAMAGGPVSNLVLGPKDQVVIHRSLARSDPPTVYLQGDVAHPGRYPLGTNLRVADLIRLGGGLKRSADTRTANLTRYLTGNSAALTGEHRDIALAKALEGDPGENLVLRNGDVLTIREVPGWNDIGASVTIAGEVRHPGTYGIRPGERLSSVLERAGGFLPTGYPQGIVFEREEVRNLQQQSRQQLIQRLRQQAASFKTSLQTSAAEQAQLQQAAYQQSEQAIRALEQAPITGRMVIQMTGNLRRFEHSPDNVVLQAGDRIVIPKRPSFVLVTGQVYNANAVTFVPHRNAGWYLGQAGGATPQANKKDIFIVRANGSVVSGRSHGWWLHGGVLSAEIEPGDTIVVPEKAVGGSVAWKNLLAMAQLAQGFSIAALAAGL
jgi:polysaccharide export outer membrane protein